MTGYMAEMRKLVGHRTIIQCAASIICMDEHGRILLGKRKDNHKWGYSGGSVEIDERVEDCAKRELYEEMGLTAEKIEFFFVNPRHQIKTKDLFQVNRFFFFIADLVLYNERDRRNRDLFGSLYEKNVDFF